MDVRIKKEALIEIAARKAAYRAGLGEPLTRAKEKALIEGGKQVAQAPRTYIRLTPIEVMLTAMEDAWNTLGPDGEPDLRARREAVAIAAQAAPYLHPKLSSVEARVDITSHEKALEQLE